MDIDQTILHDITMTFRFVPKLQMDNSNYNQMSFKYFDLKMASFFPGYSTQITRDKRF